MIPKSAVGELKEDSSNVVQLIKDAYNVNPVHWEFQFILVVLFACHKREDHDKVLTRFELIC